MNSIIDSQLELTPIPGLPFSTLPDIELEESYIDMLSIGAHLCNTSIAALFYETSYQVWHSCDGEITPALKTFITDICQQSHLQSLIVTDMLTDELFKDHPLTIAQAGLRFFATFPILDKGEYKGCLCFANDVPVELNDTQILAINKLCKQIATLSRLHAHLFELHQSEQEDKENEELMHLTFHHAIDAVVILDQHLNISQWNSNAEKIFGWLEIDVKGRQLHETIIESSHRCHFLEKIKECATLDTETANKLVELSAIGATGNQFDIELGIISPATVNGKQFFICFISDVTDKREATRKIDEQKKFYESILNVLPSDIAVFDTDHKYLFVNPYAISEKEYRDFIVGKDDFDYCEYRKRDKSLAQLRRDRFLEVKKTGKEIRWEDTVRDASGSPFTSLRRIFPVFDENKDLSMVIGFGLDITDRKVMEEKQTLLVNQLSAQNTQLIDFCNIISHNLRAPLVNMSMLVEYIQESEDEEEKNDLINRLNPVIENLHNTFNELVESIQIKQDLEIESEEINLHDCLKRVLNESSIEISKSDAIIHVDFTYAPVIYYPFKYLFSIFQNLVTNALKYKSPKRPPVISIQTQKTEHTVLLSIQDNGLGIDMAMHKDNIFKIGKVFHRHPNAKGFGLFMTKTQVEAMGGKIWVESTPDVGSTFFIEFKLRKT